MLLFKSKKGMIIPAALIIMIVISIIYLVSFQIVRSMNDRMVRVYKKASELYNRKSIVESIRNFSIALFKEKFLKSNSVGQECWSDVDERYEEFKNEWLQYIRRNYPEEYEDWKDNIADKASKYIDLIGKDSDCFNGEISEFLQNYSELQDIESTDVKIFAINVDGTYYIISKYKDTFSWFGGGSSEYAYSNKPFYAVFAGRGKKLSMGSEDNFKGIVYTMKNFEKKGGEDLNATVVSLGSVLIKNYSIIDDINNVKGSILAEGDVNLSPFTVEGGIYNQGNVKVTAVEFLLEWNTTIGNDIYSKGNVELKDLDRIDVKGGIYAEGNVKITTTRFLPDGNTTIYGPTFVYGNMKIYSINADFKEVVIAKSINIKDSDINFEKGCYTEVPNALCSTFDEMPDELRAQYENKKEFLENLDSFISPKMAVRSPDNNPYIAYLEYIENYQVPDYNISYLRETYDYDNLKTLSYIMSHEGIKTGILLDDGESITGGDCDENACWLSFSNYILHYNLPPDDEGYMEANLENGHDSTSFLFNGVIYSENDIDISCKSSRRNRRKEIKVQGPVSIVSEKYVNLNCNIVMNSINVNHGSGEDGNYRNCPIDLRLEEDSYSSLDIIGYEGINLPDNWSTWEIQVIGNLFALKGSINLNEKDLLVCGSIYEHNYSPGEWWYQKDITQIPIVNRWRPFNINFPTIFESGENSGGSNTDVIFDIR